MSYELIGELENDFHLHSPKQNLFIVIPNLLYKSNTHKYLEMEQFSLFNPQFLSNDPIKPKRKIKTAVTRRQSHNIIFPDYFQTDSQSPFILDHSVSSNFRYSRELMKRSQKENMETDKEWFLEARAQTREKGRYKSDYRLRNQEHQSFYKTFSRQRTSQAPMRKIQSHNEPRYLVKKNDKWVVNKIQKNVIRSSIETKADKQLANRSKQTEDFMQMMAISYGIRYAPSNEQFAIASDSHPFVLECIKKRPWWTIRNTGVCLIWKQKAMMIESQRHKTHHLLSTSPDSFDYLKKEYPIAKMLWCNSKPRENAPFVKLQAPYLSDLKEQLKKIPTVNPKDIKLFAKIGHKKYLNNSTLIKLLQNHEKYFPKTYFQKSKIIESDRWVIKANNNIKIVDSARLKNEILKPYEYYQQYESGRQIDGKQTRMKAIVLIVSLNGLLKVFLYQQFLAYSVGVQNQRIIRAEVTVRDIPSLLHTISSLFHSLFSQIHKKLLTKVHCFELFEVEIIPTSRTPLLASIKPVTEHSHPVYQTVIENVFLIIIDPIFRPQDYQFSNHYKVNKFQLVFDSFADRERS